MAFHTYAVVVAHGPSIEIETFEYHDRELALRFARACAEDPQFIAVTVEAPDGEVIFETE